MTATTTAPVFTVRARDHNSVTVRANEDRGVVDITSLPARFETTDPDALDAIANACTEQARWLRLRRPAPLPAPADGQLPLDPSPREVPA